MKTWASNIFDWEKIVAESFIPWFKAQHTCIIGITISGGPKNGTTFNRSWNIDQDYAPVSNFTHYASSVCFKLEHEFSINLTIIKEITKANVQCACNCLIESPKNTLSMKMHKFISHLINEVQSPDFLGSNWWYTDDILVKETTENPLAISVFLNKTALGRSFDQSLLLSLIVKQGPRY